MPTPMMLPTMRAVAVVSPKLRPTPDPELSASADLKSSGGVASGIHPVSLVAAAGILPSRALGAVDRAVVKKAPNGLIRCACRYLHRSRAGRPKVGHVAAFSGRLDDLDGWLQDSVRQSDQVLR
jgi:hypothetical protein